jgi:aryl-alcohol dehydrogenase-like predicted oxidoreductase
LQTDYIDVYMIHRPDTRMPVEETLRALDDLMRDGKIRYTTGCNFEAWRLVDAHWTAKEHGLTPLTASQFAYSMMARAAEAEMIPACRKLGIGVIPYLPLAAGMLTGKVNVADGGSVPAGTRLALQQGMADRWITPSNLVLISLLTEWAQARGHSLLDLAFAWLLAEPVVATVIAGASSPEQIAQNAAAAEWALSTEDRAEVDAILDKHPAENSGEYFSAAGYFNEPTLEAPKM